MSEDEIPECFGEYDIRVDCGGRSCEDECKQFKALLKLLEDVADEDFFYA